MSLHHVVYSAPGGLRTYCRQPMPLLEAERQLRMFRERYMDGSVGKTYPNGKGAYPFTNPRIVEVR